MKQAAVKKVVELTDRANRGTRLLIVTCPHCGKQHIHGGGKVGEDIQLYGGHRTPHCWTNIPNEGYEVTIPAGIPYELKRN